MANILKPPAGIDPPAVATSASLGSFANTRIVCAGCRCCPPGAAKNNPRHSTRPPRAGPGVPDRKRQPPCPPARCPIGWSDLDAVSIRPRRKARMTRAPSPQTRFGIGYSHYGSCCRSSWALAPLSLPDAQRAFRRGEEHNQNFAAAKRQARTTPVSAYHINIANSDDHLLSGRNRS